MTSIKTFFHFKHTPLFNYESLYKLHEEDEFYIGISDVTEINRVYKLFEEMCLKNNIKCKYAILKIKNEIYKDNETKFGLTIMGNFTEFKFSVTKNYNKDFCQEIIINAETIVEDFIKHINGTFAFHKNPDSTDKQRIIDKLIKIATELKENCSNDNNLCS